MEMVACICFDHVTRRFCLLVPPTEQLCVCLCRVWQRRVPRTRAERRQTSRRPARVAARQQLSRQTAANKHLRQQQQLADAEIKSQTESRQGLGFCSCLFVELGLMFWQVFV